MRQTALARRGESEELLNTTDVLVSGRRFRRVAIDSALIDKPADVARVARLRACDAVYVALALDRNATLLTLDSEVRTRVAQAFPQARFELSTR